MRGDSPLCGHAAVLTLMFMAKQEKVKEIKLLKYANSGDVPAGDKKKVVGYSAMMVIKKKGFEVSRGQGFKVKKKIIIE